MCMYHWTMIFVWSWCFITLLGQEALERYPHFSDKINEVAASGMVAIEDIPWVARTIGHCMRVTLDEKTFEEIQKHRTDIDRDALYARDGARVKTHLLFSWKENPSGRLVGHFDLLYPKQGPVALLLAPDVSRFWCIVLSCVILGNFAYIYKNGYVYIYIYIYSQRKTRIYIYIIFLHNNV